ncbi:hypothetical protein Tco_1278004 [Tanacetum coccineum]
METKDTVSSCSETKDVYEIKYKMSKVKERCMAYFRSLHSLLQVLSKEDLKRTCIEHGFKRAFISLFGQDDVTFTSTMFLNVDQLKNQIDKYAFQKDRSMAVFWVLNRQFHQFFDSQFSLDCNYQMTDKYFVEYIGIELKHFRYTLLQHMGNVKKFVAERTHHQRQYDRRVNKRQMQMHESKFDLEKKHKMMVWVLQKAVGHNQESRIQAAENEHLNKENEHLKHTYKDLYDSTKQTRVQTKDYNDSLTSQLNKKSIENADLKAQIQKKVFANATLENELRN